MKVLYAALAGSVASLVVCVMAMVISYIKCSVAGITYNFSIALPIAMKGGVVIGSFLFVLALVGGPRRRPPH
jgi:uncharacterized paraquat-inducible protein A